MPEERKLASILFADIVGSATLGNAEDPELVRRTFARVFAEMRQVLTAHGGTVEKFVGDAVMAVFGVPAVHDDDAERAVRAAFELRERVAALGPSLPFPLSLRIGINSGQVVAGTEGADTLVTGPPVNAAARLQQHASPDEIVVGALTRSLTASSVRYGDARTVEAKGMGALEISIALALESALPEQRRGLGQLRAPLIGRDAELRLLHESHRKAGEESAAYLMTVYGQAGVGKSRLVAELVEIVGRERVLRGRCLPYGAGITYWPLQEMLRADMKISPDDNRDEALRKLRSVVLAGFGQTSDDADAVARRLAVVAGLERAEDALPGTSGADLAQELRWGIRRYFEERAKDSPLTLIFDDIHWAEDPMLELIEHLAEWSRAPLFILCLARPDLRDRRPSWGGGLMNVGAVRLEPLTDDETRRLIAALLAIDDLPDALRDTITERAQGNPLYVEELLRMLIGAGHIEKRDGRWVATRTIGDVAIPASLQGLLAARLDQLAPEVKRVLQRASVVGKVFYPDAVTALGPTDGRVDELLVAAARRDFVIERNERGPGGGRAWQFKHILIRDVAYESVPKEERSRLHDAAGRWLESVAGERRAEYAEIVAHHADEAYRHARDLRQPEAVALGRRALSLLLVAARRAFRSAERDAGSTLFTHARDIADAIAAPLTQRVEATAYAALARGKVEGIAATASDFEAALSLARSAGPSEPLARLLMELGWRAGTGEATAAFAQAAATARSLDDRDLELEAMIGAIAPVQWVGDIAAAHEMLADVRRFAEMHGSTRFLLEIADWEEVLSISVGDFEGLARASARCVEAAQAHESRIVRALVPLQVAIRLAVARGDFDEAMAANRRWIELIPVLGLPGGGAYTTLGRWLLRAGRYTEAIEALAEAVRRQEKQGLHLGIIGEQRQALARAQLHTGRLAEARASAEHAYKEIGDDDAYSRSRSAVALAMVRAAEGNDAEAERLFRSGIAVTKGFREQAIDAGVDYARFLLDHGRAAEARPLLEEARAYFAHPMVTKWREEIEKLLRRCDEVRAT